MGSSAKKKREKKKDFQVCQGQSPGEGHADDGKKPKLKVGKSRPKAANQTDTSFRSKAIVLNQQLNITAPSAASQFDHHVSLLTSKSDSQRRDSLNYLATYISSRAAGSPPPQPTGTLLTKLCPLILDGSSSVRTSLLKVLRALPADEVRDYTSSMLPYIRAGMTHLAADIRVSAVHVLSWLLEIAGDEVVSTAGGWYQTLDCFVTVLGWQERSSDKWVSNRPNLSKAGTDSRTTARNVHVLAALLHAGLGHSDDEERVRGSIPASGFPVWDRGAHRIPAKSSAYAYLNLFGAPTDAATQILDDQADRMQVFDDHFRPTLTVGLDHVQREGGEVGRAAAVLAHVLKDATRFHGRDE